MPLGTVRVQPESVQVALTQVATSSSGALESVIVRLVPVIVITGFTPLASPLPLCIISRARSDEPLVMVQLVIEIELSPSMTAISPLADVPTRLVADMVPVL